MTPAHASRFPVLLAALALLCYLPGIGWGLPDANAPGRGKPWGVDDETPLGVLSTVREIGSGPSESRNLGYPLGHPLVVTAASAPYLGFLRMSGGLRSGSVEYPHGLTEPVTAIRRLAIIARLVSVAFAVTVVLAAWFAARELWGSTAGALAGLMTTAMFPMFYYSRTGNVDMAQLGWMACAFAAAARITKSGSSVRRAAALGVFVGAAVGTKEAVTGIFLALPPALLWFHWLDQRTARLPNRSWWRPALAVGVAAGLSFGVFSGWFLDAERYLAHVAFVSGRVGEAAEGKLAFMAPFPWTLEGHLALLRVIVGLLADALTWPGLVLGVAGAVLAVQRRLRSAWFVLPPITYLTVLFLTARVVQLRYVLPAAWVLALFAAYAAASAWQSRQTVVRWGGLAAMVVTLGLGFGRGLDLTLSMRRDTRYEAARWFADQARPGARIAYFGSTQKIPPLAADVHTERAGVYKGAVVAAAIDEHAVAQITESWSERPPDFVLLMPDHSSPPGVPYPASCPPLVVEALNDGRLGFRLVAVFEESRALPWLGRPDLDYPTVSPPIRIYLRGGG